MIVNVKNVPHVTAATNNALVTIIRSASNRNTLPKVYNTKSRAPFRPSVFKHHAAYLRPPTRRTFTNMGLNNVLLALFLASVLRCAHSAMELGDLNDDSYTRVLGSDKACPKKIRFRTEEDVITAESITVNEDSECQGTATIPLTPVFMPAAVGSKPVEFLSSRVVDVERFYVGKNEDPLPCGIYTFNASLEWIFFNPENELDDVKWTTIYGTTPPFARPGEEVDFDDDERYLLIGDICFYQDSSIGDRVCFPADATVQLENGSVKTMDKLSIGDRVQVGSGVYSDVFAWTHKTSEKKYKFVQLTTEDGNKICATGSHYIYADGQSIQMKHVRVGMSLIQEDGSATRVVKKEKVVKRGLYNPQTVAGDIVVNGVVATTYTAAVQPEAAHALLAPVRAAFQAVRGLMTEHAAKV